MQISNDLNDDRYQNIRIVLTLSSLNLYEFRHTDIEFPVDEDVFGNSGRFVNEAINRALKVGAFLYFLI